jgi:hypothetical protein
MQYPDLLTASFVSPSLFLRTLFSKLCRRFATYNFYTARLLALRPTPKLGDYYFSAANNYNFNIIADIIHILEELTSFYFSHG